MNTRDTQNDTQNDSQSDSPKIKNEILCYWSKLLKWLYGVQQTTAWEKKKDMVYHTSKS